MHFLYIKANHSRLDLLWSLQALGHTADVVEEYAFDINPPAQEGIDAVERYLKRSKYDYAISYLFFGAVSDLCRDYGLPYIGWIYDSPLITLYDDAVHNPNNFLFVFDRREYEHLQDMKLPHLYHMPLATNTDRTGGLSITQEDVEAYSCDVSFVGSLYEGNPYNQLIHLMPEEMASAVKQTLMRGLCHWQVPKEWPYVTEDIVQFFLEHTSYRYTASRNMDPRLYIGILLYTRKLAEMDRLTILNAIAAYDTVDFYTTSTSRFLDNIRTHAGVEYYTDMNKVFHLSRINLNITLPSIESGIPLRVFDITGIGGFCLTNAQPEIEEHFRIGEEIEVFHSAEECVDKVHYYLSHESQRQAIAIRGYERVIADHTYTHRLREILRIVERDSR